MYSAIQWLLAIVEHPFSFMGGVCIKLILLYRCISAQRDNDRDCESGHNSVANARDALLVNVRAYSIKIRIGH